MKLRKLQKEDAPFMLEWMHDDEVVHFLSANFAEKKIEDCLAFIEKTQNFDTDMSLAITNEENEYVGTVSLKHIDHINSVAEFAISIRKTAMGKGYASYAMAEILKKGIEELKLKNIYWCVSCENKRAVRFYDKNKYLRTNSVPESLRNRYSKELNKKLIWYVYAREEV